jgi:NTP pyrophosphatase (non-canonical NTP hydrolase)
MLAISVVISICLFSLSLWALGAYGNLLVRHKKLVDGIIRVSNNFAGLSVLQQQVGAWSSRNFPTNRGKAYRRLLGAFEELGELSHAHLKAEQGIRGTPEEHRAAKKDAVADAIIYLADYCYCEDIDMGDSLQETWEQVRTRDWVKFPKNGRTE